MRLILLAVFAGVIAACAGIHTGKAAPTDRRLPPSDVPGATTPGQPKERGIKSTSKIVAAKHAPVTLVATDSSKCAVTQEEFQATREGDSFVCAWAPAPGKSGT